MQIAIEKHRFDVSLEDLQTFITVGNLGGIGRAARHLNLAQPSVSNRVRRLEEKMGVKLLEREERGVSLTRNGRDLHVQALEALIGLNAVLQRFHAERAESQRELDLAVSIPMALSKLPPILGDFHESHARIAVRVHERSAAEAIQALLDGRCELALMACDDLPEPLDHALLVIDECAIVAAHAHPLNKPGGATLAEALAYPLLSPSEYLPPQARPDSRPEEADTRLTAGARGVSHPLSMIAMAAAGLGVLILPRSLIPPELSTTFATIAFSDCTLARRFGLAWVKGRAPSPQARAFRSFITSAQACDRKSWPDRRAARARTEAALSF